MLKTTKIWCNHEYNFDNHHKFVPIHFITLYDFNNKTFFDKIKNNDWGYFQKKCLKNLQIIHLFFYDIILVILVKYF